ncbi:hypothetical protein [Streptococcus hyointestinalis]|uniref:hypothetical protein n=1 Tax=Streptococcus hyointestinalis TaxID=1337 RepID=UPI0013DEF3F0|nr:hypothetical protein [Streptococcus hyointestinalis]
MHKVIAYQNQRVTEAFRFPQKLYFLMIYSNSLLARTRAVSMLGSGNWQAVSALILRDVGDAPRMTVALVPNFYAKGLRA